MDCESGIPLGIPSGLQIVPGHELADFGIAHGIWRRERERSACTLRLRAKIKQPPYSEIQVECCLSSAPELFAFASQPCNSRTSLPAHIHEPRAAEKKQTRNSGILISPYPNRLTKPASAPPPAPSPPPPLPPNKTSNNPAKGAVRGPRAKSKHQVMPRVKGVRMPPAIALAPSGERVRMGEAECVWRAITPWIALRTAARLPGTRRRDENAVSTSHAKRARRARAPAGRYIIDTTTQSHNHAIARTRRHLHACMVHNPRLLFTSRVASACVL